MKCIKKSLACILVLQKQSCFPIVFLILGATLFQRLYIPYRKKGEQSSVPSILKKQSLLLYVLLCYSFKYFEFPIYLHNFSAIDSSLIAIGCSPGKTI